MPVRSVPPSTAPAGPAPLRAAGLTVAYGERVAVADLDLEVPPGSLTVVLGPNACGKSTLLRALAGVLPRRSGTVLLDGHELDSLAPRALARRVALLPQSATAPDGLRVADLVARGRYPHRTLLGRWTAEDDRAVHDAMAATGVLDLSAREVSALSGGQRQRVWIAMTLAQETPILLLDEPTTFLDLAHQVEVLELCAELHAQGRTLVVVLHDIAQAARYATHLVVLRAGRLVAQGPPADVLDRALVAEVFGVDSLVAPDPVTGTPVVYPLRPARSDG
ncbi:MAG: ABC transporter ATP-binding protein [Actinomycetaceae bacterium]